MIGLLFVRELSRAGRGRMIHFARWAYAGWLVVVLYFHHAAYWSDYWFQTGKGTLAGSATTDFAHRLVDFLVFQQTMVLLLAGPSFAAGAVTDEKVRNTLEPLFLAHLTPGTIILGKLLARVAQGFLWSLTAWPVIAFAGFPGGVTPVFFVALAVITILMLTGTSAASLLASVWCRTTRDAAIWMYVVVAFMMSWVAYARTAGPRWEWLAAFDPNFVLDTARDAPDYGELGRRLRLTTTVWLTTAIVSAAIAAWRLRPAYIKQLARKRSRILSALQFRPPMGDRPIVWKEQHSTRIPRWFGVIVAAALSTAGMVVLLVHFASTEMVAAIAAQYHWYIIFLMSLAAGVRASAAIITERDRHTWDCLVGTPYDFRHIVGDKVQGICLSIWPYYFAMLIPALAVLSLVNIDQIIAAIPPPKQLQSKSVIELMSGYGPRFLSVLFGPLLILCGAAGMILLIRRGLQLPWYPVGAGAVAMAAAGNTGWLIVFVPVGILIAGVIMHFMAGVGIWMSARTRSGWLSLLGTVVIGYLCAVVVLGASCPLGCVTTTLGMVLTSGFQELFGANSAGISSALWPMFFVVGALLGLCWAGLLFIQWAVQYLEKTDRVPGNYIRNIELGEEFE